MISRSLRLSEPLLHHRATEAGRPWPTLNRHIEHLPGAELQRPLGRDRVDHIGEQDRTQEGTVTHRITELIGVYRADGGPVGEVKYVLGKMLGRAHCALCDVTHSPVRRKPEWDRMVAQLGVPFTLLHLNDMPTDVAAVVARTDAPVVLARTADGGLSEVLGPAGLDSLAGSVSSFHSTLVGLIDASGTSLPRPSTQPG